MTKTITIQNCLQCPNYSEENNVYRDGSLGYVSKCSKLGEIEFTDKMDTPNIYDEVHKKCPL